MSEEKGKTETRVVTGDGWEQKGASPISDPKPLTITPTPVVKPTVTKAR